MGIVKKNGIMIVDFALIVSMRAMISLGYSRSERRTFSSDHYDNTGRTYGRIAARAWFRRGRVFASPAWSGYRRRPDLSQLITLFITPVIYLWLEWFQEHVLDRVPFLRSAHFHEHEFTHKPDPGHPTPVTTG